MPYTRSRRRTELTPICFGGAVSKLKSKDSSNGGTQHFHRVLPMSEYILLGGTRRELETSHYPQEEKENRFPE